MSNGTAQLLACTIITVVLLSLGSCMSAVSCHMKWSDAGYADVKYRPIAGCKVQTKDGRWIPTDKVREVE